LSVIIWGQADVLTHSEISHWRSDHISLVPYNIAGQKSGERTRLINVRERVNAYRLDDIRGIAYKPGPLASDGSQNPRKEGGDFLPY